MPIRIQLRRDTAAEWVSVNPILEDGEPGVEVDTARGKFGDGVTRWNSLPYADAVAVDAVVAHEASTTAHSGAHVTVDHTAAGLTATDVQAALAELQAEILSGEAGDTAAVAAETTARSNADAAEATARANADALLIPLTQKAAANGVATLDSSGLLPAAQLPPLAISDFLGSVASQVAMLALVGQKGDWCVRTDTDPDHPWMIVGADPTQLSSWQQMDFAGVSSVDGLSGTITLPSDAAAGVGSKRTLGTGATQAAAGADLAAETATRASADTANLATATNRALVYALVFGG